MDSYTKCFDFLPSDIVELLPTAIQGLKLERVSSTVGRPIIYLINECANFLYHDKFQKSEVSEKLSHCLNNTRCVLDITWEKLNTGYWKDIDISWRYVYSYASLFKALFLLLDKTRNVKDVIKACDMGLIMGVPILKNILSKIAFALTSREHTEEETGAQCKRRKTSHCSEQQLSHDNIVPEAICPSLDEFESSYMEKKQPVVLKSTIDFWPALSSRKWSVDYLMKIAHHRTVPVEIGSKYTDENWTQKLITLEEFVSTYIWNYDDEHQKVGYLAQYQLFDQIPQLKEDFSIPTYCCLTEGDDEDIDVDINAWFGPAGTVSPLHYDPKNNLLAQVFGEKYVRLYQEEFTSSLYPTDSRLLNNTSQVDVENPDHKKFPLFATVPYQECILKPGDVLFIPPKCWHYVRSLSVSFSISFWWK